MSEITPLTVTLELPASEFIDHDNGLYVRCPLNGQWVPLKDYYSEIQGSLLPLVGNVDYVDAPDHWDVKTVEVVDKDTAGVITGSHFEPVLDEKTGQPVMIKVTKATAVTWKETIRILPKVVEAAPEGGTLNIGPVAEQVKINDQMV